VPSTTLRPSTIWPLTSSQTRAIAVLDHGKLVAQGTASGAKRDSNTKRALLFRKVRHAGQSGRIRRGR